MQTVWIYLERKTQAFKIIGPEQVVYNVDKFIKYKLTTIIPEHRKNKEERNGS